MDGTQILDASRSMMKAYAAREYKDDRYRSTNEVEVNIPEYTPTLPRDEKTVKAVIPRSRGFFLNINYPETEEFLIESHCVRFPLMKGTTCPVRLNKGAEFMLLYPTGKIDEGYLIYLKDGKDKKEATK